MASQRAPISIICVFNDPEVRRGCLDRSIDEHHAEATVEYLPIDNTRGTFPTAGAALNHGASLASHEHLVFVHQDVYLHSLRALEEAAGVLAEDERIGLVGPTGVSSSGEIVGRVRDRVVLLGEPVRGPTDVDSLDELLFVIPRRLVRREPLSEAPELAWHAYAVEYGLRVRSLGLRVCAVDIPLTHNSLTVNLDRLDLAYSAVAIAYPEALPLRTPSGTVTARAPARPGAAILAPHRWRYRWLRESLAVHAATRAVGGSPCVLSDIRWDIDEVMASQPDLPLVVVNLDREPEFADEHPGPLDLERGGQRIMFTSRPLPQLVEEIASRPPSTSMLVTNLRIADLRSIASRLPRAPRLLGFRREIGFWMLLGPAAGAVPQPWRAPKSIPVGCPALAR
jgi:Glycosyltransferase like family